LRRFRGGRERAGGVWEPAEAFGDEGLVEGAVFERDEVAVDGLPGLGELGRDGVEFGAAVAVGGAQPTLADLRAAHAINE
jgi:hypothetical protein